MLKPIIILGLCALGAGQITCAAEEDPAVVVIFGDSITSESGYPGSSSGSRPRNGALNAGLPSQELTRILNESRRPSLVPNWGHGGSPSGRGENDLGAGISGVDRISNSLATSRSQHAGSQYYVLIMYGANDEDYGLSSSDTGFNIRQMIDRTPADYTPVIATLTPRTDENVQSRNSAIRSSVAIRPRATLVEMFDRFNAAGGTSLLLDNVHPTAAGYTVIAETWFNEFLAGAIEAQRVVIAPLMLLLLDDD